MFLYKILLILLLNFICRLNADNFLTEYVTMKDGKKIAVDFYRSLNDEKLPAILEMTPYGKRTLNNFRGEADFWYQNGYIFVIADVRGTGDSEGEFEIFANDGQDGYDIIEWIAKQSWSNGKVGMRGSSYTGTNQWYVAAKKPKNLFCITPSASAGKQFDYPPYNKAFALEWIFYWLARDVVLPNNTKEWKNPNPSKWLNHRPLFTLDEFVTGKPLNLYRNILKHPTFDSYWDRTLLQPENYSQIDIPSLGFTGWYDFTMHGTIMHFKNIKKYGAKKDHFIIIGPYSHETAPEGGLDYLTHKPIKNLGDLVLEDNAFLSGLNITREFYDWCLKDGPKPEWSPAKIYITGENRWIETTDYVENEYEDKYLYLKSTNSANSINGDGELDLYQPRNGSDTFDYDPDKPVMSNLSKNVRYPVDMNFYLNRTDFLVYTSPKIKQAFNIFGEVKLELTFSSNVKDTDFVAFLMDVDEYGNSIKIGSMDANQLRTRYRHGYDKEILMEPNKIYNLTIDMYEIGHQFLPGHRVRLAITSSFFPIVSRNLNTGNDIAFDMHPGVKSKQTIYYGSPLNGMNSRIHFRSNNLFKNSFEI